MSTEEKDLADLNSAEDLVRHAKQALVRGDKLPALESLRCAIEYLTDVAMRNRVPGVRIRRATIVRDGAPK